MNMYKEKWEYMMSKNSEIVCKHCIIFIGFVVLAILINFIIK